jgi:hypothetical protein
MRSLLFICMVLITIPGLSQEDRWKWWNDAHNWHSGMPGWRNMMILSPDYLGPNALPVPELKKGILSETGEVEASLSGHFSKGDPTQDLSGRLFFPFSKGKIAFEVYGVLVENYNYSEEIRDLRFSRDKDGKGIVPGDFYFATLIQLSRNRKFPNTVFRLACKTASGDAFAARYTDTPGYFFDFSSSKDFDLPKLDILRPYATFGFYSWQTYNEATPQNDAWLYGAGLEYQNAGWHFSGDFSGYSGYLKNHDRPQVITLEMRHDWPASAARIRFLYGLRDWNYQTVRFSYILKINGK